MSQLKKVILFVILIFCFFISSCFAVDINFHPNNTTSNSSETENTTNSLTNSINPTSENRNSSTPAVSTSTASSVSNNKKLTTSDVIDIIVASIGIVNLLLGIAILIRFK